MTVDLRMPYMRMLVSMNLTLMQGHSGSAKAHKNQRFECSRQLSKQRAFKTCYNARPFFFFFYFYTTLTAKRLYGLTIFVSALPPTTRCRLEAWRSLRTPRRLGAWARGVAGGSELWPRREGEASGHNRALALGHSRTLRDLGHKVLLDLVHRILPALVAASSNSSPLVSRWSKFKVQCVGGSVTYAWTTIFHLRFDHHGGLVAKASAS